MNDFYVNAAGAAIAPQLIDLILMRSGLQWEMHPAQVHSLEMQAFRNVTVVTATKEGIEDTQKIPFPETKHTLMGLPVAIKYDYPMNLIRLMFNGEEITRIEFLAVPCGFENYLDFDKHCEDERQKMQKIGLRIKVSAQ
jgi:hypothetical protein